MCGSMLGSRSDRPQKRSPPTTPNYEGGAKQFRVTHPFHPLFGQQFELASIHRSGGGWRVFFADATERLISISAALTDLSAPDPFVVQAAGRSYFRVPELLEPVRLIAGLREQGGRPCVK